MSSQQPPDPREALTKPRLLAPRVSRALGELAANDATLPTWHSERMAFITGPHASGKTSVTAQALRRGYASFDLGPIIRGIHQREATEYSLLDWLQANEAVHGEDFGSQVLVDEISPTLRNVARPLGTVIIGSRSLRGIEYFKRRLRPVAAKIIYFDAPTDVLHANYQARQQQPVSQQAFAELLAADQAMGLNDIREHADHVIENVSTMEAAVGTLCTIMAGWQEARDSDAA